MNNSTNDMSERLVNYLDGELSAGEKEEVEKQLVADKALQEELENLQLARAAVRQYGLQKQVASVHQEMMKELQTPVKTISQTRRIARYTMGVAAGLLLILLGVALYNSLSAESITSDKVFADNYKVYELNTLRDADNNMITPIEKAYREKDYEGVVALSQQRSPVTTKEFFLLAMSYMEIKNDEKAIETFNRVIAVNDMTHKREFSEEAEYYRMLARLRAKKIPLVLEAAERIQADTNHLYHEKITNEFVGDIKKLKAE